MGLVSPWGPAGPVSPWGPVGPVSPWGPVLDFYTTLLIAECNRTGKLSLKVSAFQEVAQTALLKNGN